MSGRVSLVAHRGQPLTFPENSLQGFQHVLEAGAKYLETDVNITADGIPVLSHDANLLKLTGKQIILGDHAFDVIKDMSAGYKDRFGDQFSDFRISTLEQFVSLMSDWPDVHCFIELKEASINYFRNKAVDLVIELLEPINTQCTLISFDADALSYARKTYDLPIGWVLPDWSDDTEKDAIELKPDYLFIDSDICPDEQSDLWSGRWDWVVYSANTAEQVEHYAGLGIELIETNRYSELKKESAIVDVSNDF